MERVTRTGASKTLQAWHDSKLSFDESFKVGDFVDEAFYDYFMELLPPAYDAAGLFQVGEPNDHRGLNGRARYMTIQRAGLLWVYTGNRERGERVEIV